MAGSQNIKAPRFSESIRYLTGVNVKILSHWRNLSEKIKEINNKRFDIAVTDNLTEQ